MNAMEQVIKDVIKYITHNTIGDANEVAIEDL